MDGWALTMLRPENASYAATCNAIGQTLGASLGVSGYLLLAQFKIMTLSSFMFACGPGPDRAGSRRSARRGGCSTPSDAKTNGNSVLAGAHLRLSAPQRESSRI